MQFRHILLSISLASLGLFMVNHLLNAQTNTRESGGGESFTIYICGVTEATQYTLFNQADQAATTVNEYYQSDGTLVAIVPDVIPANGSQAYTVGDHVPAGFGGDAVISSDMPLTATVETGPGTLLTAEFVADPVNGPAPLTVTFTNLSVGYDSVLWDFGDGVTSTLPSPTHTYATPGTYTATLTTDKVGCLDNLPPVNPTQSMLITIRTPEADLAVSQAAFPEPVTAGEPLIYTLTISNNGPDSVSDLVVTDTLPAGVTFLTASEGCSPAGSVGA